MAVIDVDHQLLTEVASAIDTYCTTQDAEMKRADEDIKSMLSGGWTGSDAQAFGSSWERVDAEDSTTVKFRASLQQLGEAFIASAKEYRTAQEDAYNAANRL